jgi:hypothetical protein
MPEHRVESTSHPGPPAALWQELCEAKREVERLKGQLSVLQGPETYPHEREQTRHWRDEAGKTKNERDAARALAARLAGACEAIFGKHLETRQQYPCVWPEWATVAAALAESRAAGVFNTTSEGVPHDTH